MCDSLHNYHGTVYNMYFSHKFVFVDPISIWLFRVLMKHSNHMTECIQKQ